jgi:hypothetical protein
VASEYAIYAVCLPRRLNDPMLAGVMQWLEKEAQSSHDVHPPPAP